MVNPGGFPGSRKSFLADQKDIYAKAVANNHLADTVADIQRRYFKRYPITLPHDKEPSEVWLTQVDDDAVDPELEAPNADSPDWEDAFAKYDAQISEVKALKDKIKRRLHYQYTHSCDATKASNSGSLDPLAVLKSRLNGNLVKKPRMRTAYNLWGPEHRFFVDPIFEERVKDNNVPTKNHAALRSAIYKELFNELPKDEQHEWTTRAEEEHRAVLSDIERKMNAGPSTAPEDRQRVIQSLASFVEPILDLIADHNGWKVTLIAGGPEPADAGRLNMISIHSGVTNGTVKMNFARSERQTYREFIIPAFGKFLKKSYSIEECRARALPADHDTTKLSVLGVEEDLDVHRFDIDPAHINVAKPYAFKMLEVKRAAEKEKRTKGSTSEKTGASTSNAIKIGPPRSIKTKTLRTLPTKDAASVRLGPQANASADAAVDSHLPISGVAPPPSTTTGVKSPSVPSVGTHTGSSATAPSPNGTRRPLSRASVSTLRPSRGPTPVPSRAPTPVPSRAPTPAPTSSPESPHVTTPAAPTSPPALPHAATPAPTPLPESSRAETSAASTAPTSPPALPRAPTLTSTPPLESPMPAAPTSPPPALPRAATPPPTLPLPESSRVEMPAAFTALSPPALVHVATPAPTPCATMPATPIVPTPTPAPPPAPPHKVVPTSRPSMETPPGAATVPDFSSISAPTASSSRSRKRKEAASEGTVDRADQVSKKTRSAGPGAVEKRKLPPNDEGPKKRHRGNAQGTSMQPFEIAVPQGCPLWLSNAVKLVTAADLGEKWKALVSAWIKLEEVLEFTETTNLGSTQRPRAVTEWIRRARKPEYRPEIKSLSAYEKDFKAWWASLQPARLSNDDDGPQKDAGLGEVNWRPLRLSGQNGILSVVAALFFWGWAAHKDDSPMSAWEAAVDVVHDALTHMV